MGLLKKACSILWAIGFFGIISIITTGNNSNQVSALNLKNLFQDVIGSVSKEKCLAISEFKLPNEFGLDTCVGSNLLEVIEITLKASSKCSILDLYAIPKNTDLVAFGKLLHDVAFNRMNASSLIYEYMQKTSKENFKQVCKGLNTKVSPCFEAIFPKLLELIKKDTKCCSSLNDALDMLTFVIPKGTPNLSFFLLNDLLNGLNQFVCGTFEETSPCGYIISSQFMQKYSTTKKKDFSILNSFLLPLMTIPEENVCDAMEGKPYMSTMRSLTNIIPSYSCCIHQMLPLVQYFDKAFENALALKPVDFLNGIVNFPSSSSSSFFSFHSQKQLKFVSSINAASKCQFKAKCQPPKYLIPSLSTPSTPLSPVSLSNKAFNSLLKDIKCKQTKICDKAQQICSTICEKGSVEIPFWLKKNLDFQRQLSFQGSICSMQLPASHNSAITLADGYGNRDQLINDLLIKMTAAPQEQKKKKKSAFLQTNNQVLSLTDQLQMGVRFLEVDVHFFLNDFYIAHCGGGGGLMIDSFLQNLSIFLSSFSIPDHPGMEKIQWSPNLLGCFPSFSGIKANEQIKVKQSFEEISNWIFHHHQKTNTKNDDFLLLYLDTGKEIGQWNQLKALEKLIRDSFGEFVFVPKEKQKLGIDWSQITIQQLINRGKKLLILSNQDTLYTFDLNKFCGHHIVLDVAKPIDPKKFFINGDNKIFTRVYQSSLRYISIQEDGTFSNESPTLLTSKTIPKFVQANINLIAPDLLDMSMIKSMIWTWGEKENFVSSNGIAYIKPDGRWYQNSSSKWIGCYHRQKKKWQLIDATKTSFCDLTNGFQSTCPFNPFENHLLVEEMKKKNITTSVQVKIPLL